MKRLFFLLILSVMMSACHKDPELIARPEANPTAKTEDVKNVVQPNNDCLNDQTVNNSHSLNKIAVLGCPVK